MEEKEQKGGKFGGVTKRELKETHAKTDAKDTKSEKILVSIPKEILAKIDEVKNPHKTRQSYIRDLIFDKFGGTN